MKKILFIFLLLLFITSCKSKQKTTTYKRKNNTTFKVSKPNKIVQNARYYLGTKYQYGGVTKKGMDCSGLVYTSFKKENIVLPRTSRAMATQGKTIPLNKVEKGDLIFFITGKKNRINHVGLVTNRKKKEIFFIHSSTKKGVIVSSMQEKYYKNSFVKAKRIL